MELQYTSVTKIIHSIYQLKKIDFFLTSKMFVFLGLHGFIIII